MDEKSLERAILFVDGNNFYHSCARAGVTAPMALSYSKMSLKLVGAREWSGTRYYVGAMKQNWGLQAYADQRTFLSLIQKDDARITVHLGRIEERTQENPLVGPLLEYTESRKSGLSEEARKRIRGLAGGFGGVKVLKEKAVDIMLAVDVIEMASEYDVAYLLSADGDFTPVVQAVRARGKKAFVVSPGYSSELQKVASAFIQLQKEWFKDCYR